MWAIRMNFQRLTKPAECSVNYQLRKCSLILHIRPRFEASNHFSSFLLRNFG